MKKYLFIVLWLLVSGCAFNIKNKNTTSYQYISPSVKANFSKKGIYVYLPYIDSDTFNTKDILYEENGHYNYYAYSKWLNSPTNMLKNIIYKHITYITPYPSSEYTLKIILFDFEPHFDKDRNFFYLKSRVFLYDKHFKLIKDKIFSIKEPIDKTTNASMLKAANKSIYIFLKALNDFILGSVKS